MSNDEEAVRTDSEPGICHQTISTDPEDAGYEFLELVAELEGCDVTGLPPMHPRIDDIIAEVFSDPPSKNAQVEIQFSYYGYRVDLDQKGNVSLMRIPR